MYYREAQVKTPDVESGVVPCSAVLVTETEQRGTVFILPQGDAMASSEAQKRAQDKYNKSKKGKAARKRYNSLYYISLKEKENRRGTCNVCKEKKWLLRKNPMPICRRCDRKLKSN